MIKKISGGITAPQGFLASGVHAGIKKVKKDMALIYSELPCMQAGTFTTNVVKAAPVKWDMHVIYKEAFAQAIVVNSGVANACTGTEGYGYCLDMAEETGKLLDIPASAVLVASTGVIGKQLPMDKIKSGIHALVPKLQETEEGGSLAAEAIMTTDTVKKEIAYQFEIDGKTVTVGAMCKGSGMIHPNMCTMLSFITTDLSISKEMLQKALSEDIKDTYNMVSIDGDTSTNDTVLLLANAAAGNEMICEENQDYEVFVKVLRDVNTYLSRQIAGDGEGATALFEVKVTGAAAKEDAVKLSKSVVTSSLAKAAIYGHDANCGRFLCAMGYAGVDFEPEKVDLFFESAAGQIQVIEKGTAIDFNEERAAEILSQPEVTVLADINMGTFEATAWGCDLTYDYVKINADYRS